MFIKTPTKYHSIAIEVTTMKSQVLNAGNVAEKLDHYI